MSTMPRPVLPEPVIPTMTPWVVRSAESSVEVGTGSLVGGGVDQAAEMEVSHDAST